MFTSDTPQQIQQIVIEGYRRMSPEEKLRQVGQLTQSIQALARARIREQYGDIPEREQRLRLAALWLDKETMIRVFNWNPNQEGY